jgi:acylphosphatase
MGNCMHCVVSGRVQGVGFRAATRAEAARHGLTGWVRNTHDGDVELVASGGSTALEALLEWLRKGPPAAQVIDVRRQFVDCAEVFSNFSIRF